MLFNSVSFIFYFLPLFLVVYYATKGKVRQLVLFIFSIGFYAIGGVEYVKLMLIFILISFLGGLAIDYIKKPKLKLATLFLFISILAGVFIKLKYYDFIAQVINSIIGSDISMLNTVLPIGISFYTFQVISYMIDVYNEKVDAQKNIITYGAYVSMFSQLIAGPIIRFEEIEDDLLNNKFNVERFRGGVYLFIEGLFIKVVLADNFSTVITQIQDRPVSDQYVVLLWLMMIMYTLQIYLDFNGYSKMARGLGGMMGYEFPMNFNFPYTAVSISDFWRRWHMTLTRWFKDYIYIPLGGSRVSKGKVFRNVLIVWLFTGIWHGAGYTFVFWGLWNFFWIYLEKEVDYVSKLPKWLGNLYTIFIILIGWTFFMAPDFPTAITTLKGMFFLGGNPVYTPWVFGFIQQNILFLIIAVMYSYNKFAKMQERLPVIANELVYVGMFLVSIVYILTATASAFLYFNF